MSDLAEQIEFALGRGEFPENELRQFRFLWVTTPDQEKDGFSVTLKGIEEMVADMRREMAISSGASKLRRVPTSPNNCCVSPESCDYLC